MLDLLNVGLDVPLNFLASSLALVLVECDYEWMHGYQQQKCNLTTFCNAPMTLPVMVHFSVGQFLIAREAVAFKTVQPLRSVQVDKGQQDLDARV
jgi:hypothetical protein